MKAIAILLMLTWAWQFGQAQTEETSRNYDVLVAKSRKKYESMYYEYKVRVQKAFSNQDCNCHSSSSSKISKLNGVKEVEEGSTEVDSSNTKRVTGMTSIRRDSTPYYEQSIVSNTTEETSDDSDLVEDSSFEFIINPVERDNTFGINTRNSNDIGNKKPDGNPISGNIHITSNFGIRIHPIYGTTKFHRGIDISCKFHTKVSSTANGVVEFAGFKKGYGYYIIINHRNGYKTAYAHLSKIRVRSGQKVKKGGVIGFSGSTGISTGPHLHYEVIYNGRFINPRPFLNL